MAPPCCVTRASPEARRARNGPVEVAAHSRPTAPTPLPPQARPAASQSLRPFVRAEDLRPGGLAAGTGEA